MKRSLVLLTTVAPLLLFSAGLAAAAAIAPGAATDARPAMATDEIVVQFTAPAFGSAEFRPELASTGRTGLRALDQALAAVGAREIVPVFRVVGDPVAHAAAGLDRIHVVRLDRTAGPLEAVRALSGRPELEYAEPNGLAYTQLAPNDTYSASQWAHRNTGQAVAYGGGQVGTPDCDTDTDDAWDLQTGSSALTLAIIDTGVDTGHPEFSGRVVAGYDFVNSDSNPADDEGHGTCCAGIAVGAGNNGAGVAGVAWGVKLMPVKVLNASGSGTYTAIANGITWAADHGAKVLSLSLGGSSGSTTLLNAVNYAYTTKGCVLFCASGNNNSSSLSYPAAYANTIGVGALSPCNERKSPSSCDGEYWWGSNYGSGIDFLAPGTRIHSTDIRGSGGYASGDYITDFNGTSAATPHAAGIGALAWSQNPDLTNAQLWTLLQENCDDIGAAGYDTQTGHGRMNAHASVLAAGGGGEPPPPPPPTPVTIFSEGFESSTVPGSVWSATDANSTSGLDYWGDQSSGARKHGGSWSAYCADYSNVSGQKYDHNMQADMTLVNPIDLTGYTGITFSFWLWYRTANSSDYVELQYWNGSAWVAQQRWSGTGSAWINPTYSVTGSSLRFRFYFYSNSSRNQEGAYVDDILVTGTPAAIVGEQGPTALALLDAPSEGPVPAANKSWAPERLLIVPNPTAGSAELRFALADGGAADLAFFAADGRMVSRTVLGTLEAGPHAVAWSRREAGRTLPAGLYFVRLQVGGRTVTTERLLLLR